MTNICYRTNRYPIASFNISNINWSNKIFCATNSYDPDGDIDFYRWNFGDGTSEILDISPAHSYSNLGTYEVVLTVIDTSGTSDMVVTTVTIKSPDDITNQTPVANAGGPYSGNIGGIINFDGSYSSDLDGDITNYTWDFGDNTTGYGISTTHSYSKAGTYVVNLTVTDNQGNTDKTSTTVTITTPSSYDRTPGFEFLFAVLAAAIILLLKKKKQ